MREINVSQITDVVERLCIEANTHLPGDVKCAIRECRACEDWDIAKGVLDNIITNFEIADNENVPICQDTGLPTFKIKTPIGVNQLELKQAIQNAMVQATKNGKMRPNSVDSISGDNSGDNLGIGLPVVKFEQWEKDYIDVRLILKGGGCENKNIQYSLPCE